jgi:peptidyl-prolyl cis-trans isomerase D
MLQSIRDRSRSWGAKIIIGAVVAAMALFGVDSLIGLFTGGPDEIARVNGEPITRHELELEVQRAIRSGQVPPEQERALRNQVLEELIADRLMTQYSEEGGLYLSEGQLDQMIVTLPEFQDQDGRFSRELFRNRLASAGFTPLSFREALREDMKRQQLQQGLAYSSFSLPAEQERLAELQRQIRSFRYHTLSVADLDRAPEADEAAIREYYEANQEAYQRPEQVRLEYVIVDREQMAADVEVEEQAVRERWQELGHNADRRVSHIMLTFGEERSREEAVETLQRVRERLEEGESFAELAAEMSEDPISAEQGGDLGEISRGFFGEAFDETAFSLDEGEVSEVVETDNGLHLLKVTEIDRAPFDDVREALSREVAASRVSDAFNQRVQRLIDESFAADDLESVAEDLDLELHESDWVSREGAEGVLAEPGVMSAAFSEDVLEEGFNSEVIELDEERRMVLRVADHREATVLPLEEVRGQVEANVEAQLQREALTELAKQRLAELRAGEAPEIDWQHAGDVSRQDGNSVPEAVVASAFRLPVPEGEASAYGHAVVGDRVVLIALDSVQEGEADSQTEEFVATMAERLRAQAVIEGLRQTLRERAGIERF